MKSEHNLEYSEILRESNILIAAGNETSATAMTNRMFLRIRKPRVLSALCAKLDPIMLAQPTPAAPFSTVKDPPSL
ncbi:MAG: Cytochrome E- group I [Lasallia pustulata]|uniref:Cytochrome E-group I n=1 Tax=Lasallia pustulata TaxID=136370 RepID=A0A5M8PVY9_9LECA|nr:MAG: Cytochrome E- group I [Lasallia pustulata]